ncbi:MAG: phytoene desaturase family protein [Chloroflexota bacterium]
MAAEPIVIIGAGIGGLSAAIRLAAAGRRVIMLEQNAQVGGKMGEIAADGFRWDTGPSVITMRPVFEELFAAAGRRLDDYLTLLPVEPLTRYFYPDGVVFDATRDLSRMVEQIAAFDERDVEGYLAYLTYAARIHRVTGEKFIYNDPPTLGELARTPLRDIPAVDPLRTMDQAIRGFVRSPYLRQFLGRFATYVGASPYLAPATLNVIAHVELTGGIWYPRGGIYAIARAFERLARELGVEVRLNSRVQRIEADGDKVSGVSLVDGAHIATGTVIANVDVGTVYERLIGESAERPESTGTGRSPRPEPAGKIRLTRPEKAEMSCSGFILMLGIEELHPKLAQHNIFFSTDYQREFNDIFTKKVPPDDPTIYVAITSKADADHAPAGCENWFVLVNVPALGSGFDWTKEAAGYRDRVLAKLAQFGLDVRDRIRAERMLTPIDLERLTGARHGALYGTSSNDRFNALRRPHNRAKDVKGLYFAGGTTHPGGGVPLVILSGKVAARMVIEDGK